MRERISEILAVFGEVVEVDTYAVVGVEYGYW